MGIYYDNQSQGFFDERIHGKKEGEQSSIPKNAVEVSSEDHKKLIAGRNKGKRIVVNDQGVPSLADKPLPTLDEARGAKIAEIEKARKAAERDGVSVGGIRYAGDPGNRQALREAIEYADAVGQATFNSWKTSDDQFIADHPVDDVRNAYQAIGARRSDLIEQEGQRMAAIDAAQTLNDVEAITW